MAEQLLASGWRVYGVSRRRPQLRANTPLRQFSHVQIDLRDDAALQQALRQRPDITHIFDCASAGIGDARLKCTAALLDVVEAHVPYFRNINLLQGMKYYGCHLGPFPTPARESDARVPGNVFYYADEDLIRQRQAGKGCTCTALRPHAVCGFA
jgi:nucleoside-diphosphate-sugar epimerase